MLALLRNAMLGAELPSGLSDILTEEKLASLYGICARHDLGHIISDALLKSSLISGEGDAERKFVKSRELALYRYTQSQHEYKRICDALSSAGVDFIPLKGVVIGQYYPKAWMRTSCDIDILVKEEELSRAADALVVSLGYKCDCEYVSGHDIGLLSPSGVRLELHYRLLGEGDAGAELLSDPWSLAEPVDVSGREYVLKDEAFYFYHIAHMAAHFKCGGCGVRSLVDLWLLNRVENFDKERRRAMLSDGGLLDFAVATERLSDAWLSGEALDESLSELSEYIIKGGVYGNAGNRIRVQQTSLGGRFKYLMSRIFISNKSLKKKYPILEKRPYLSPIYHVWRWLKPIFSRKSKEKSLRELEMTKRATSDEEKMKELLSRLGL